MANQFDHSPLQYFLFHSSGASKLLGEQLALQNNPESIIIRTSWVYSFYGKNFVKTMMRLMNEKESIG
ncbi:MAG: sugar nucleotide-binding protein, partial [Flavisolibacter sp.]|nr:sugar nucleotide-binding protein [Flavisolibacter sp.]